MEYKRRGAFSTAAKLVFLSLDKCHSALGRAAMPSFKHFCSTTIATFHLRLGKIENNVRLFR
jgi:hypothetical protein